MSFDRLTKQDRAELQLLGILQMRNEAARTGHEVHYHGREELRGRYRAQLDAWARMSRALTDPGDVVVELPMYAPEALPGPTLRVRWWVLPDDASAHPCGCVSGRLADVVDFVRAHWGDEELDSYASAEEWAAANPCAEERDRRARGEV